MGAVKEAVANAQVVVDLANSPSFEDKAVREFFETPCRNLPPAEAAAGVRHHAAPTIVAIAGADRAPFNEIVARYLKAVSDRREVVSDPEARYFGGRVEEGSVAPLGGARLGRITLNEWLRHSRAG